MLKRNSESNNWIAIDTCDFFPLHPEINLSHILHGLVVFISQVSVSVPGMNGDNTDSQKLNKIISEIQALQEVVARFRQLRLDATEFACLKCIVTFKAGKEKKRYTCKI